MKLMNQLILTFFIFLQTFNIYGQNNLNVSAFINGDCYNLQDLSFGFNIEGSTYCDEYVMEFELHSSIPLDDIAGFYPNDNGDGYDVEIMNMGSNSYLALFFPIGGGTTDRIGEGIKCDNVMPDMEVLLGGLRLGSSLKNKNFSIEINIISLTFENDDAWIINTYDGKFFCEYLHYVEPHNDLRIINTTSVYPNPVEDILNIDANKNERLNIINSVGSNILSTDLRIGNNAISTQTLPSGVYFLMFKNTRKTVKLVKL